MILLWVFVFFTGALSASVEFVIVTASYNNERYCIRQLESVANQRYPHWSMIYINDCSQDKTGLMVEDFVYRNGLSKKIQVIHNTKRKGAMANIFTAVHMTDAKKVIVCVDGDDRLSDPGALEKLAKVYEDPEVWVTYGNYKTEPGSIPSVCKPFPQDILKQGLFRSYEWVSSHPKTFYAGLFHKIKKQDLQLSNKFVSVASDVAFMIPILEMAANSHIRFIEDILYIYNYENPINDQKIKFDELMATEKKLREKKRYPPLKAK